MKRKSLFCAALLAMTVFASTGEVRANTEYDNLRNAIQNASSTGYELQGNATTSFSARALGTVASPNFTITGNNYSISLDTDITTIDGITVNNGTTLNINNVSSFKMDL